MKKLYLLFALSITTFSFAQTINFNGCTNLFENATYTFTKTGDDAYGRKIYITTPIDGTQSCGGLGTCEFKLQWNDTAGRWEFLADTGNGDFVNPFLIYYSATGNNSATNPPNITIGNWQENTAVTNGDCGGNLTNANATFTGDVRTTTLAITESDQFNITVYPNPATEFINIKGLKTVKSVNIISLEGKQILKVKDSNKIDISKLVPGVYLVEIETDQSVIQRVKIIKK